jgi:hypothetical protein
MTLAEIRDLLAAEPLFAGDLSCAVEGASAADLMSDVLASSKPGMLLLTSLASPQVLRTAVVADLCGVVLCGGKRASAELISLARAANLPLLATGLSMFEAAGLLYAALARG